MARMTFVIAAGVALGTSVVIPRLGVEEVGPLPLVALRLPVACPAYAALWLIRRIRLPRGRRTWIDIAVVGLTQVGPLLLFTTALQFISSGVLTVFISLVPLLTYLLAARLLRQERLGTLGLLGLAVGFGGVLLLLATGTTGLASGGSDLRGHFLALGGAVLAAFSTVYARRRLREIEAVVVTGGQLLAAWAIAAPLSLAFGEFHLARFSFAASSWPGCRRPRGSSPSRVRMFGDHRKPRRCCGEETSREERGTLFDRAAVEVRNPHNNAFLRGGGGGGGGLC